MLIDENDHKLSENGQRKYLILVDDNSELLRAMSEFLRESLGYDDVQTFESVEEAISFLDDSKQIDVILMDQKMQGDEGAGIMAISKLHEIRPFIPIIIYTNTSYDMGREAIEKGAAAYIRRSDVSYEILAHIIDSAIYTARLEREVVRLKRLEKIMDCVGAEIMVVNEGMEIELVNEFKRKKRNVNEDDIRNEG